MISFSRILEIQNFEPVTRFESERWITTTSGRIIQLDGRRASSNDEFIHNRIKYTYVLRLIISEKLQLITS